MAKFNLNETQNYGGVDNGSFFVLEDDGDSAVVRFLYRDIDEFEGYCVHEVEANGKKRYVDCLRSYDEPLSKCPLCEAGSKNVVRFFLALQTEDGEVKIWDRGRSFNKRITALFTDFPRLCDALFVITRVGEKGNTNTKYKIDFLENSPIDDEELPEMPIIISENSEEDVGLVLSKTSEQLAYYVENGYFEGDEPKKEFKPRVPRSDSRQAPPARGNKTIKQRSF